MKIQLYGGLVMKNKVKWIAALGLLLPVTWLGSVSTKSAMADLERLHWLCSDYQLPVQGYVVEGWFQVAHVPGMERFLGEQLELSPGAHCVELNDGSILTTIMQRRDKEWHIELQLIAKNIRQAAQYYNRWQHFSNLYCPNHPIGVTVVAELPEPLDIDVSEMIIQELADGLALEPCSVITEDRYLQLSGFTEQLQHKIYANGTAINGCITVVSEAQRTCLYIASPMLYQQI